MDHGLPHHLASEKLRTYGRNRIINTHPIRWYTILFSQFPTFINGILFLAAVFSIIIADVFDGIFILAVILLNGFFGFLQEYRAEKSLEKLRSYTSATVRVIRDGKETQLDAELLVPGDLVILSEGDRIPADGTLISSHHIEVDESVLTGEAIPVIKRPQESVFLGTLVTRGKGDMVVVATGMQTEFGQIAKTLHDITPDKTPLQKQLALLGKQLSLIAFGLALLLIPIGMLQGRSLLPMVLLAVSLGIAAIPEGLPAIITIALAVGTNRMAKRRAIVRKMPSVETLGAIQVLLVDKTGTLTKNAMAVKKFWVKDKSHLPRFYSACLLGNTASLIQKGDSKTYDIVGDRTDGALLFFAKTAYPKGEELIKDGTVLDEYVFDSKTKTITTTWQHGNKTHVFVRGAPESILSHTTLSTKEKEALTMRYESFAKEGLRVIAFGTKEVGGIKRLTRDKAEDHLTFLGFVGIYDPPRTEVGSAIAKARTAGIQTVMVTGDNELTALTIAKEIGLIDADEDVMTGSELATLSDQDLKRVIAKTRVFARAKPHDKLRLTKAFKRLGYVVGVTGDGVNDALALKQADVGVAMGKSGTDVAKEASDIILTDDNFATLVAAIEEGRVIYHNMVKAITYLLASNLSELALLFCCLLLNLPTPLKPTQILWINLITDGLPALALALDTKNATELKEKPRDPGTPILPKMRLVVIFFIGINLALALTILYIHLLATGNVILAQTVLFNTLIFSHLGLAAAMRGQSFFKPNSLLLFAIGITAILQYVITTNSFFQELFHLGF